MTAKPDVVVIGAGVNGLTAAALLAKAGRRVVVLERRDVVGGLAAGEEFHPGYRTAGVLHDTTGLREGVVDALELARHGLTRRKEPAPVWTPVGPGSGVVLHHDPARAAASLQAHSAHDAAAYRRYRAFLAEVAPVVRRVLDAPPPDPAHLTAGGKWPLLATALAFRRLGKKAMMEVLRVAPMCVADWMNEYFETETLKTAIAWPGVASTFAGPWSPGTAANLLLSECAAAGSVTGGPAAVARALEAAARAGGVTLRTGAAVEGIEITSGAVSGVRLAGGEVLSASTVATSCDPRHTFLDLVPGREIPYRLEHGMRHYRGEGLAAAVHLAVRGPVVFPGADGQPVAHARLGRTLDDMERSFDPVKYGELPEALTLAAYVPSVEDPSLAPEGCSVISVLAHCVPFAPGGGWNDTARNAVADRAVAGLSAHLPDLAGRIEGREVLAPPDLEARYGVVRGHLFHGDHALDQILFRPIPECAQYRTPIPGLFLCGSGSHPGGGVTGGPGALAAKAILG